jgi:hypothetical protein
LESDTELSVVGPLETLTPIPQLLMEVPPEIVTGRLPDPVLTLMPVAAWLMTAFLMVFEPVTVMPAQVPVVPLRVNVTVPLAGRLRLP